MKKKTALLYYHLSRFNYRKASNHIIKKNLILILTHNNNDGVYRLPLFEQRRDEILFHSLAILWLKFPLFAQRQTTAVLRFFKNMIYKQITISRGRTTAALRFVNNMINKQMTTCWWKKQNPK